MNFTLSNTQVAHGADFTDYANNGGHNFRQFVSNNGIMRTKITGTSATAQLYGNNTTAAQISVDGGAWVTPTFPGASAWYFIPLFSGLSDGPHDVKIRSNNIGGLYIDKDNAWQVTGSTPAVALPTGYSTSNQYQVAYTYASSSTDVAGRTGILDYTQRDGGRDYLAIAAYTNIATFSWLDQRIRFKATCTQIDAFVFFGSVGAVKTYVDGIYKNTFNISAGTVGDYVTLATGLNGSAEHEYTLNFTGNPGGPGALNFMSGIVAVGGTINTTQVPAVKTHDVFVGDSITQGQIGTANDSSLSWASVLSLKAGTAPHNRGISGSTVTNAPGSNPALNRITDFTSGLPTPTRVFILYGTNDMNQIGGTVTSSQLQTAYGTMLTNILSGLPSVTKVTCLGLLNRTDYTQSQIDPWNTAIQNAIATVNNSKVSYIPMNGVITPTAGVDTSDGLHPNAQGYAKIVTAIMTAIGAATGYTVTGSTTGFISQAITYTLTPTGNVAGTIILTPSDNGGGGTFSSTSITLPATSSSPVTFTYTPSSTGTKTISFTNTATLTDASNITLTITAAPSTFSVDSPGIYNIDLIQGASFVRSLTWTDQNGTAINLTGYTAKLDIRQNISDTTPIISLSTSNSRITLGGALGTILLNLNATDTGSLNFSTALYDLELYSGSNTIRLLQGKVILSKQVTM